MPAAMCRTGAIGRRLPQRGRGAWRRLKRRSISRSMDTEVERRTPSRSRLELVKCEEGRGDQEASCNGVIPAQVRAEIVSSEDAEYRERDDFLNHLELHGSEAAVADAVGRHLKAILKEGDTPADQDDLPKRLLPIFQVTVPGKR